MKSGVDPSLRSRKLDDDTSGLNSQETATNPEIGEEEWNNDSDFQGDAKKTRWPDNEVVAEARGVSKKAM